MGQSRIKIAGVLQLFLVQTAMAAAVPMVQLPSPAVKAPPRLTALKQAENQEKWDVCTNLAGKAFPQEVTLKAWVLVSWLHCARKSEAKGATISSSRSALAAFDVNLSLRSGPWQKNLQAEQVKTRFLVVESELKKNSATVPRDLDLLIETLEASDKESKARALALYGEWAQNQRDVEAAKLFFENSLGEKENRGVREKYSQLLLALNQKPDAKIENDGEEFLSEAERHFDERFASAQKNNDLLALAEDCVSYLNKFPHGKRAKWANDKVTDLYALFSEQSEGGEEKWQTLRDRTLAVMLKAEWSRLAEWSRQLHRRGDFTASLALAEKALSATGANAWSSILQYVAGRSAEMTGDDRTAQKYFETYAEANSAGDEIVEVLFRLGLVHLRQNQTPSAVAVFERLLSLKGKNSYELGARYWMVRALQNLKSPRATHESEILVQKFPFSYYGLKLRAESNQGVLEWPYPLETAEALKGKVAMTGVQKKSWDRIKLLSAAGWQSEALSEIVSFPNPEDPRLKALLAQTWSEGRAYPVAIKLMNEASELSVDYRTRDLIQLGLPKDFASVVEPEAKKNGMQPILVWSLIRQESAFNPKATSTSNAMGLMQMIPATARELAQNLKLGPLDIPEDVFNPERNIPMGTSYIAQMIRQFKSSVPVGLAAYNAGPSRMDSFLKSRPKIRDEILRPPQAAMDELWMDELPWFETSFYVKAILRNTLMYRLLDQRRVPLEMAFWKDLLLNPAEAGPSPTSTPVQH